MYNVFDTEIFGVILTILFFNIGIYIQKKTNKPIFNPLLIAILGIILFLIFLCIGVLTSMAIDKYLPETKENTKLYRVGIISMLAIILHNIPEGCIQYVTW